MSKVDRRCGPRRSCSVSRRAALALGAALIVAAIALAACAQPRAGDGRLGVVAAENSWGSLAMQLGGARVRVTSILTDPSADPHEYTSSPDDARAVAAARLVVTNGAGYDQWASKLLAANPASGRMRLDVAALLGRHAGENPHFWYDPVAVARVVDAIAADYERLDPGHAAYYRARHTAVVAALAPYRERIAAISARFAAVPVGATESIFEYMAGALRLRLISPPEFMRAIAEGSDPPAAAVVTFGRQLAARQIAALVYNVQTATAVTSNIKAQARAAAIPLVALSESLQPPGATFQSWQDRQLDALAAALARRGR